ncbi:MAG: UDP-N-acetylglucosamine diphosphorylase [Puniceicoccales bacterium]|jgi:bifunctional N-acetylglucosamine-1-phosphate-uridyltransferase/glucosamine-1-phosphate-acetyltransferase GlmU-like protein|nr:UDP-N-acetylglucosamine diphosphorylase [Puniceicoccales bacterium]
MRNISASDFFDLPESLNAFSPFFPSDVEPWNWIANIEKALITYGNCNRPGIKCNFFQKIRRNFFTDELIRIGKNVHIEKNVKLPVTCTIEDNVYVGEGTEIRSGALIRKNVIIGKNCIIGNACEIKNALIMDNVQIAHLNYVGDSILGSFSHLSGGALLSNLRFDERVISVKMEKQKVLTGLRKFGAILGERAQIGCNSVLLPGTLLGKNSLVSVGTVFGGFLEENKAVHIRRIINGNNIMQKTP